MSCSRAMIRFSVMVSTPISAAAAAGSASARAMKPGVKTGMPWTLRANVPAQAWEHRFGEAFSRLTSLLGYYTPEDRGAARDRITPEDRHLTVDLLSGRLDLR